MRAVKSVSIDSERRVIITFLDGSTETLYPNCIWCDAEALRDIIKELLEEKADAIVQTINNVTVASFEDGADEALIRKLLVSIDPIQDLHGYDSPWPAGGGKNLFDKDATEIGKWLNVSTGAIESTTTNYALSNYIPVKSGLPYVFTNPQSSRVWFYDAEKNPVEIITMHPYTPNSDGFVLLTIALTSVDINTVQFEQGTTLSAYTPYSNICPISGRTGLTVYRSGSDTSNPTEFPVTWESEAGIVYGGTLDVVSGKLVIDRVSVVYDGSSDENWGRYEAGSAGTFAMRINIADIKLAAFNEIVVMSNEFIAVAPNASWGSNYSFITTQSGSNILVTGIKSITTVADWRAYLATSPLQVIYKLNTPTEIQLAPQEITTLLGDNNIWADSGNILELEYVADTKLYIGESQPGTLGSGSQTITRPEIQPISDKTVEDLTEAVKAETEEKEIQEETNDERGE